MGGGFRGRILPFLNVNAPPTPRNRFRQFPPRVRTIGSATDASISRTPITSISNALSFLHLTFRAMNVDFMREGDEHEIVANTPGCLFFLSIALPPAMTQSTTAAHANQTAPVNECTSKMSVSECDSMIERDLASAVRNKEEGCLYEPTWRPTDVWGHQTGHLMEVHSSTIVIAIGGEHFALQNNDCVGDCSRWKPAR